LGVLKVPIGYAALIHGGKKLVKIGNYGSHGCVGLTNDQARVFARLLAEMGGVELTDQQILMYGKKKNQSQTVTLERPIPVELRYDRIVLESDGIHVFPDVYGRGGADEQNVRAALNTFQARLEQLNEVERSNLLNAIDQMNQASAL